MKRILALAALVALCVGCTQGGPPAGGGSVTMYGTVDEGIVIRK